MRILMYLDVDTPDLDSDEEDDRESAEENILEGLTSVDMEKAIAQVLAQYYVWVLDEDVQVTAQDAIEVQPAKDGRKLLAFQVYQRGGLKQTN